MEGATSELDCVPSVEPNSELFSVGDVCDSCADATLLVSDLGCDSWLSMPDQEDGI